MVNLPVPAVQSGRPVGERGSDRFSRSHSHHIWGARWGVRDELCQRSEPTSLPQLEELARRAVLLMEKYSPKSEYNYTLAMDLLRQQYNLNFMIICDKCSSLHFRLHDEIIAPER